MTLAALSGALPAVAATSAPAPTSVAAPSSASSAGAASASTATGATAAQRAATQFERMLLEQLTKELAATAAPADGEGSAATAAYRDLLPGTMADALSAAGGVGLAAQLAAASTGLSPAPQSPTGSPS